MSQSDIRRKRTVLQKPIDVIDRWFTTPEPNAAGNLGLFRVLYASFYLWFLSSQNVQHLVGVPADHRQRVLLIDLLPADPPAAFFVSLEILLVAALCLLVVGFRVRLATWVVLVVGSLLEAYWVSFDPELGTILLVFFIPFFMLLGNAKWSETYSVDAILRQRAGERVVEPTDPSWPYSLPARAVLVVLAALFLSSALHKVVAGGTWLSFPQLLPNELLRRNITATILELRLNPLAPAIAEHSLRDGLRWLVLLFEATFVLALLSRLRAFYVAFALIFHSVNALWLWVTFTPVLVVYGLFVDWQALKDRIRPPVAVPSARAHEIPIWALVGASVLFAGTVAVLWNHGLSSVVTFGGRLDRQTIWYPILPVAAAWLGTILLGLGKGRFARVRSDPTS